MQKSKGDALLVSARVLIILIQVILMICLVGVGVGIGVLLTIGRGELYARIVAAEAPAAAFWAVIAGFGLVALAIWLAARFFALLHDIVKSVDRGDPFDPANALRLRRMGWLSVLVQLVLIPLGMVITFLKPYLERLGERVEGGIGMDPATLLLILVLFILARVFERGAELRRDVEGTV